MERQINEIALKIGKKHHNRTTSQHNEMKKKQHHSWIFLYMKENVRKIHWKVGKIKKYILYVIS